MNDMNDEPQKSIIADRYDFSYQAARIAKHIGEKDSNHVCVGVSGSWGSGKTSLLYMVKELLSYKQYKDEKEKLEKVLFTKAYYQMSEEKRLKVDQRVIYLWSFFIKLEQEKIEFEDNITNENKVIWFDPWFFGSEETIIKAFLFRIAKELFPIDKQLSFLFLSLAVVLSTEINLPENLPVVGNAFKLVNAGLKLVNLLVPELIFQKNNIDFSDIKEKIIQRLDLMPIKPQLDDDGDLNRTVENVEKIIILIDDLDRLQVDEALTMLKLIRLLTEFPKINVVVSFDEQTLSKMIDNKLNGYGREYISKMINTPTEVPTISTNEHNTNIINAIFDSKLSYYNKPLLSAIHREYWFEISNMPYNYYPLENDKDRKVKMAEDLKKLKIIQVLCDKIQLSYRDVKRISHSFHLNYNENMNPIHYLGHLIAYFIFYDEYNKIMKNNLEYFVYEERYFNIDNIFRYFDDNERIKNKYDFLRIKEMKCNKNGLYRKYHLVYMSDRSKILPSTNHQLFDLLSTITPDVETLKKIEEGEPYPFTFYKSISLFKNECIYGNFKPSFD